MSSYENIKKLLKENNTEAYKTLLVVTETNLDIPYIIQSTLEILEDDSVFGRIVSDVNKIHLCNMMDMYMTSCYTEYIECNKYIKLTKFSQLEIYKVEAEDGLRYATSKEVALGVKGLIPLQIYPAGELVSKMLNLLCWTFTGYGSYYRKAGYELKYNDSGEVVTSFYEQVQNSANGLMNLFKFMLDGDELEKAFKKIGKIQRANGYKYLASARDEITENISIKQLMLDIFNRFPRHSDNKEYRKALSMAISYKNANKRYTPLEISKLREIYETFATDKDALNSNCKSDSEFKKEVEGLRQMCDKLESKRYKGIINPEHFCYKIITTVKGNNYTKCSPKQYSILEEAYKIISDKPIQKEESSITIIDTVDIVNDINNEKKENTITNELGTVDIGDLFSNDDCDIFGG